MTPDNQDNQPQPRPKPSATFLLDLRWVVLVLIVIVGIMLVIWKPWTGGASDRTIEVTGETTIKATPDQFVFHPSYQFTNADREAALAELAKKSNDVTAGLEQLGVAKEDIKTNSSGSDYMPLPEREGSTYSLQLTVTVDNQEFAQKVQDYLVATTPTGSITPNPTFSEAKRKQLEAQARDQAIEDARAKADQTGEDLGFGVGKVKSVSDGTGLYSLPYSGRAETTALDATVSSPALYPGENELPYSITVVYYIR